MQTILVTGASGFIGSNLVLELLRSMSPVQIIGLDNMNDYYDVSIKEYRLEQIAASAAEHSDSQWTFIKGNLADKALIDKIFADYQPEIVVNLAAQAGVRYSITNPDAYIESNLIGFTTFWKPAATPMTTALRRRASCICFQLQRIWLQQKSAVFY